METTYVPASTEACLRVLYISQAILQLSQVQLPPQLQTRDQIVGQLFQAIANEINPIMEIKNNG
jgi:hypothetical protein